MNKLHFATRFSYKIRTVVVARLVEIAAFLQTSQQEGRHQRPLKKVLACPLARVRAQRKYFLAAFIAVNLQRSLHFALRHQSQRRVRQNAHAGTDEQIQVFALVFVVSR